jgi:hypothetical protein
MTTAWNCPHVAASDCERAILRWRADGLDLRRHSLEETEMAKKVKATCQNDCVACCFCAAEACWSCAGEGGGEARHFVECALVCTLHASLVAMGSDWAKNFEQDCKDTCQQCVNLCADETGDCYDACAKACQECIAGLC